jgi:SpoVK/Ycf46/Vps4 family AAA+-type ATPase
MYFWKIQLITNHQTLFLSEMTTIDQVSTHFLPRRLQSMIYRHQKTPALKMLNRMIDFGGGLFSDDPREMEYRRKLWMVRIQLLREWEMFSEALAWICLECDVNPSNVAARALKDQWKEQLNLKESGLRKHKAQPDIWSGVAGMRDLKAVFEEDIILPLKHPEIYSLYKIPRPNGILLYGPPGCGKTFIVNKLAKILRFNFINNKPSDLGSVYIHGSQLRISELFDRAEQLAPTLLFIDELDALLPRRDQEMFQGYKSEVNEFLVQLDNAGKRGILVIGATNFPNEVDSAALRPGRLDKKIFVGPPDMEARAEAFRINLADRPAENVDYAWLAEESELFSFAEIELAVVDAAREAARHHSAITQGLLFKHVRKMQPALTEDKIHKYQLNQ